MKSAVALITGGMLLLTLSLGTWAFSRPSSAAGNALAFEQALAGTTPISPPSTIEPLPPATTTPDTLASEANPSEPTSSPLPRFTIGEQTREPDRVPIAIRIPALDQAAPIIPTGIEANGDMEVPDNVDDVAWYKYGSAPGEPGSAVLAAHVDLAGQGPGVFFDLRTLEPGNVIYIDFDDGSTRAYRTEARAIYDKEELPTEAIFSREGPAVLTLITCGGDFNRSIRSYDSNVVVYAVPFTNSPPPSL
jgi:LPXTG-site transpeptidase (sortase) family protein